MKWILILISGLFFVQTRAMADGYESAGVWGVTNEEYPILGPMDIDPAKTKVQASEFSEADYKAATAKLNSGQAKAAALRALLADLESEKFQLQLTIKDPNSDSKDVRIAKEQLAHLNSEIGRTQKANL